MRERTRASETYIISGLKIFVTSAYIIQFPFITDGMALQTTVCRQNTKIEKKFERA